MGAGRAFIRLLSEQAAKEEGAVTFAHPKRDPWLNPDLSKKNRVGEPQTLLLYTLIILEFRQLTLSLKKTMVFRR